MGERHDDVHLGDERLAQVIAQADGDDEELLRLLASEAEILAAYTRRVDGVRDDVVARLQADGVPLTKIALVARVSDSYLSRRLRKAIGRD